MGIPEDLPAQGSNSLSSSRLFVFRKYYEDFVYPIESDKPVPIDFHNRSMTYGRINQDRDWVYIVPKES